MATLTGAPTYTVRDAAGTTTYQRGEAVRADHLDLVPTKDRKLFSDPPAAPPPAAPPAEPAASEAEASPADGSDTQGSKKPARSTKTKKQ